MKEEIIKLQEEVEDLKRTIMLLLLKAGGEVILNNDVLVTHNLENMVVEVADRVYDFSKVIRVRELTEEEKKERNGDVNTGMTLPVFILDPKFKPTVSNESEKK